MMEAKDEVKERLSVEDVVGEYIELKRSGRNMKGLSPFTQERTPSLMVSPEKQIWHDFSSNQGGDMFSFVMLMEGIGFREALELLARKAGVDMSQYRSAQSGERAKRKARVHEALRLAVRYYHASLVKNKTALDYVVKERGYGKQILQDFLIGYAPDSGYALCNFMQKRGFSNRELVDAGLASQRGGRYRDMFRGRITIPLADGQGVPIGFTARVLGDGLPKYINTPQTIAYDKSRHVFGLHLAKSDMRQKKYVVIVEGNMDVVASHKTTVKNVVATAGTAITTDHLKQVHRIVDDVRLAFDRDRAGIEATERAITLAQDVGVRLSVITLPEGKDPDDLIKKNASSWEQAVERPTYVMDWLVERYQALHDTKTAKGKRDFTDAVLGILAKVTDPVEQEHYTSHIAKIVEASSEAVAKKLTHMMSKAGKPRKRRPKNPDILAENPNSKSAYQDSLLGLALRYGDLDRSLQGVDATYFSGDQRQQVVRYLSANLQRGALTSTPEDLQDLDDYVKILLFKAEELYDDWSASDRMIEAIGLARRLKQDHQQKRKKDLTEQLRTAEHAGDQARQKEILATFDELLKGDGNEST